MPGWFEDHRRNMRAYDRLAATGVLIGSDTNGRVEKAFFGGADVVYRPTEADLRRLIDGIKLACRIYLAAEARRVMPATFQFHQLDEIIRDNEDIQLGTGHPQGGHALGATPEDGPVSPLDFRVHGTDNLHCCDAGVFPTSLGVNPQLTTMALADCAAERLEALLR
jgi:choline dehydrogenase-like flavoprotein